MSLLKSARSCPPLDGQGEGPDRQGEESGGQGEGPVGQGDGLGSAPRQRATCRPQSSHTDSSSSDSTPALPPGEQRDSAISVSYRGYIKESAVIVSVTKVASNRAITPSTITNINNSITEGTD